MTNRIIKARMAAIQCYTNGHQWECEAHVGPDSGVEYFTCNRCGASETIIYY